MNALRPLLLLLTACACLSGQALAQTTPQTGTTLGRLFFAPAVRLQLERQRQYNIQEAKSLEAGTVRLDGVVVRSSGQSTVWINQQNAQDIGVLATPSRRQPGQATITAGNEAPADLKVGVTLDRATRETSGGLAGGEIRVKRSAGSANGQ